MVERYEVEVMRKVFDNKNGGYISIGPDTDGLGLIEIKPSEYFGTGYIVIPKEMLKIFAQALLTASDE